MSIPSTSPFKTASTPKVSAVPNMAPKKEVSSPQKSKNLPEKVSEDLLYGAKTYSKIADKGATIAKKFLSLFGKMYKATSIYKTPIYDTVEKVMRLLQRDKSISSQERHQIKCAALGTADIDAHHESLEGSIALSFVNNASHKHPWNESKLTIFRNFRKTVFMKNVAAKQEQPTSKMNTLSPTVSVEGISGFLWKPVSDSDGKLAILLPSSLTGVAASVSLIDQTSGKVVERGRFTGVGNGDRAHFRFNKAGGAYPDGILVKITLDDGSSKLLSIGETAVRVE